MENVIETTIIDGTKSHNVHNLKQINLRSRSTQRKNIANFANEDTRAKFKTKDKNILIIDSEMSIDRIKGNSYNDNFTGNIIPDLDFDDRVFGTYVNNGTYFIDGKEYKVEKIQKDLHLYNSDKNIGNISFVYNSIVLTISRFTKNIKIQDQYIGFYSANGEYLSSKNVNNKPLFKNKSKSWFIFFSKSYDCWILINKDPEFLKEPEIFDQADYWIKEKKQNNAKADVNNLPVLFSNMCTEFDGCLKTPLQSMEVSSTISSFYGSADDGATVTTNIKNDRILQINTFSSEINRVEGGYIRGILNCRIYGEFYGRYIDLNQDGKFYEYTKENKKIFDGSFEHINVQDGKFIGRLFTYMYQT